MRSGEIWACWLNGKPAINLGAETSFWESAEQLYSQLYSAKEKPKAPPHVEAQEDREEIQRTKERHAVTILGRLFTARGSFDVTIFDLSEEGCRISEAGTAAPGEHVSVKIGSIGPIPAVIRWREKDGSGLHFDRALHSSVLDHVINQFNLR